MIGDNWPEVLAALAVWREARGEPWDAKVAVAWVIRNRVATRRWGGLDGVVLATKQFSSFNRTDLNATKLPHADDHAWHDSCAAVDHVVYGDDPDPTQGALNYHDHSIPPPKWTKGLIQTSVIGGFTFYRPRSK